MWCALLVSIVGGGGGGDTADVFINLFALWAKWIVVLHEVDVRCDHHPSGGRHPDVVGGGGTSTSAYRLTPTHALGSMVVLEYCSRGFTANARHPKGKMFRTLGTLPVNISCEVGPPPSIAGPLVRLATSTTRPCRRHMSNTTQVVRSRSGSFGPERILYELSAPLRRSTDERAGETSHDVFHAHPLVR